MMPLLVKETRGSLIDNTHYGHIAVVNSLGNVLYEYGDPLYPVFGRSTLKPIQVLPLIETGAADYFRLTDAEVALCASSHSGKTEHREAVQELLARVGRTEKDLICGITPPLNQSDLEDMVKQEGGTNRLSNCCSGVHAGMIATAVYCREPVLGYEDLRHPVQQRVLFAVRDLTCCPAQNIQIGMDGCGIPTYGMPLAHVAWGIAQFAVQEPGRGNRDESINRVFEAMVTHPEMVTEYDSYNTKLMKAFSGRILAKEGAKGLYGFCDRETGIGVALKIEDGGKEQIPTIVNEILQQLHIGTTEQLQPIATYTKQKIENTCNQVVGYMEPAFQLSQSDKILQGEFTS